MRHDAGASLVAIAERATDFLALRRHAKVVGDADRPAIVERLQRYDFVAPQPMAAVADDLFGLLGEAAVRSDHPRYFGLFNPPALPAAIAGDLIAATVNPQLAVWRHAPAAAEIERMLLRWFGVRVGWPADKVAGTFTSGGSEANQTALLAALARRYPEWAVAGIAGLNGKRPSIYVSAQAHLAWIKIARGAGLGSDAVRLVPPADGLRLDAHSLERAIEREPDRDVALIVATAGTTAHGAIDDIAGLASVARRHRAHLHVDAAWAGGALLCAEGREMLADVAAADSVTIDPHKMLAVPMGAGMYLASDWGPLQAAFDVATGYMPSASIEDRDAYLHSVQWSRRFIGLKLFMALATLGEDGYAAMLERQFALGRALRAGLRARGWSVLNDTALPLVCFVPDAAAADLDAAVRAIESHVVASGAAWLSSVMLRGRLALRACITSYESTEEDVRALLDLLDDARRTSRMPERA